MVAPSMLRDPKESCPTSIALKWAVEVDAEANQIHVTRGNDERTSREVHGLTRALIANMIEGVTKGYEKKLEVVGVGYLAAISGDTLQLRVGYANELHKKNPQGIDRQLPRSNACGGPGLRQTKGRPICC